MSGHAGKPSPKPWPMKWVVLAIILFIVGYTIVMLRYRKPGKAYEPYQDSANRATVLRLLNSGYQRVSLSFDRPADPTRDQVLLGAPAAAVTPDAGGIPSEISQALAIQPVLAESISSCVSPARQAQSLPYKALFGLNQPDNDHSISEVLLFRKGNSLVFIPVFERTAPDVQVRWRDSMAILIIPAGVLPAGEYEAALISQKNSRHWSFTLTP